jgi:hypothetical protein
MNNKLTIVQVFLASPGDLVEERKLAKSIVDTYNRNFAELLGYHVQLVGWEDTASRFGRPQDIINRDLRKCELFIGMLWQRWGTPPSDDGSYSSGFEEEFNIAIRGREESNCPEVVVLMKDIEESRLRDPGTQLSKVLDFRARLEKDRKVLYRQFKTSDDFREIFLSQIASYVKDKILLVREQESNEQGSIVEDAKEASIKIESVRSLFPTESIPFLKGLLLPGKDQPERILEAHDIARFRLIGTLYPAWHNDMSIIGTHDSNTIYFNREKMLLSQQEIIKLSLVGLKTLQSETTPLWFWCSICLQFNSSFLHAQTLNVDDDIAIGAFKALKMLNLPIQRDNPISREKYLEKWLSADIESRRVRAALEYLEAHGELVDVLAIENEIHRGNGTTMAAGLSALVSIRDGIDDCKTVEVLTSTRLSNVDDHLIEKLVKNCTEESLLNRLLSHPTDKVRACSASRLKDLKKLSSDQLARMVEDECLQVRYIYLLYLLSQGQTKSDEEIKIIFEKKSQNSSFKNIDKDSFYYTYNYRRAKFLTFERDELESLANQRSIYDQLTYFVLCEKFPKQHLDELRQKVDKSFEDEISSHIQGLESIFGADHETVATSRSNMNYLRGTFMRSSLDVLCRLGKEDDLDRIRHHMRNSRFGSSKDELDYIRKFGDWNDLLALIEKKDSLSSYGPPSFFSDRDIISEHLAFTLYRVGRTKLSQLFRLITDRLLLVKLIDLASSKEFKDLGENLIFELLLSEFDEVRRTAAIKCVKVFAKKDLTRLLKLYLEPDKLRYYNVIFWLDFGCVFPKSIISKAFS